MRLTLSCLLILGVAAAAYAEAQYQYGAYPFQYPNYFRGSQHPQPSYDFGQLANQQQRIGSSDARFFFTTLTVTLSTSTTTTTFTSSTTCTTSTASLKICTPSGRRRRGMSVDKEGRGLFYAEQEDESEDGSIFLPSPKKTEEPAKVVEDQVRVERETAPIPYVVQPGFNVPKEAGSGRFLLAFGTSTTTSSLTTTVTSTLTATCRSTTAFQLCGSSGK